MCSSQSLSEGAVDASLCVAVRPYEIAREGEWNAEAAILSYEDDAEHRFVLGNATAGP